MNIKDELTQDLRESGFEVTQQGGTRVITLPADKAASALKSVTDQVNAGALGPGVTASYYSPGPDTVEFDASAMAGVHAIGQALRSGHAPKPTADTGDLPESLLERLRAHRGENDSAYWEMGDDIDDAVVESAGKLTQKRVYAIAAKEMDVSTAEVRLLHETANSADESLRSEFSDTLTHSHFRKVRYLHDRAVKRKYLTWCVESADQWGGRIATAARLEKKIKDELGETKPEPTVGELWERVQAALGRVYEVDPAFVWRALGHYATLMAVPEVAGRATGDLKGAALDLKEAAANWGKKA